MSGKMVSDPNDASSSKWMMILPIGKGLELVANKTTDFEVPGMSADGTIGPRVGSTMLVVPADTIFFDPITFTFIVDESYENYIAIAGHLVRTPKLETSEIFFDVTIKPLTNTGRDTGLEFIFMDTMLANLSAVSLDNNASVKTLTCTATLKFQNLKIMKGALVVVDSSK